MTKNEPALFEDLLRRLGMEAHQFIFIDDSPGKIASAEALGIESFLFKDNEKLRNELTNRHFL